VVDLDRLDHCPFDQLIGRRDPGTSGDIDQLTPRFGLVDPLFGTVSPTKSAFWPQVKSPEAPRGPAIGPFFWQPNTNLPPLSTTFWTFCILRRKKVRSEPGGSTKGGLRRGSRKSGKVRLNSFSSRDRAAWQWPIPPGVSSDYHLAPGGLVSGA
jgi:hypothetical protein